MYVVQIQAAKIFLLTVPISSFLWSYLHLQLIPSFELQFFKINIYITDIQLKL